MAGTIPNLIPKQQNPRPQRPLDTKYILISFLGWAEAEAGKAD